MPCPSFHSIADPHVTLYAAGCRLECRKLISIGTEFSVCGVARVFQSMAVVDAAAVIEVTGAASAAARTLVC